MELLSFLFVSELGQHGERTLELVSRACCGSRWMSQTS